MKRRSKSRRESRSKCLLATLCSLLCCWIFVLLLFLVVGRGPPEADSVQTESDDSISYFPPKEQSTVSHSPEVWTQDPREREERIKQRLRRWLGDEDGTMPETAIATSDSPGEYSARGTSQKKKRKEEWKEEKERAKMKPSPSFSYRKGPSPRSNVAPPSPDPLRKRAGIYGRELEERQQEKEMMEIQKEGHLVKVEKELQEEIRKYETQGKQPSDFLNLEFMKSPAVVVLAYNRPTYLRKCLFSLLSLKGISRYTVYVSQDGYDESVSAVVKSMDPSVKHYQKERPKGLSSTEHVALHYNWLGRHILDVLFIDNYHSHVVLVEDDMIFSPDFALYFSQTAHLLDKDQSLWCISSWNDNGFEHLVSDRERLFRTDYFPGLGWMLKRELWLEIRAKWPGDHWDHWMRHSGVSKGRECIVPEVSRNFNIGENGTNMDTKQYRQYFTKTKLNDQIVIFGDLSYLLHENYERHIKNLFAKAEQAKALRVPENLNKTFLFPYLREHFNQYAVVFGLWEVPRARHNHSVLIKYKGNWILLADKRSCPYLPDSFKQRPHPQLSVHTSNQGEDCNSRCAREGLKCMPHDFDFLNRCDVLMEHFPCEKGCGLETGEEVPFYFSDHRHKNFGKCSTGEALSSCSGRLESATRLCGCVPRSASVLVRP